MVVIGSKVFVEKSIGAESQIAFQSQQASAETSPNRENLELSSGGEILN